MLNRSLLQCITFAKSVYSYSRLTSHDTQQCGLFKATVWVQLKNGSGAQVTWALCQDCLGGNGGLCSPLLLRDKPLDALAGCASSVSIGGKKQRSVTSRCRGSAHAAEKGCFFQADHWHPGRPITISVSLTTMPKIPWLLNEVKPLKDLAGSLPGSWLEAQLWHRRQHAPQKNTRAARRKHA